MTKDIKTVLRMMPYGFYSLTSKSGDDVNAMVLNWVTQISFEPTLVALGLAKDAYTHQLVEQGGVFAVNLFNKADAEAIKPFSKSRAKSPDKMEAAAYSTGPETGCPILDDASAHFECKVVDIIDIGGDHDIVVGEVIGAGVKKSAGPEEILSLPDIGWSYAG
jgi:flavin reductase (DIM6/NTAB) family NADH-FMN oxidoreductase RutF